MTGQTTDDVADRYRRAFWSAVPAETPAPVLAHLSPERLRDDRFAAIDAVKALRALGRLGRDEAYHWRIDGSAADLVRGAAPEDDD